MVEAVIAYNNDLKEPIISRAFHPEGEGNNWKETSKWIGTITADVPVLKGEAAYQLSNGWLIKL